jgi:NADH-ubiquinone oxidoreductase chain 2
VAIAIPSINNNISTNIYIRISSIILLYSGLLALNAINIPSLGFGIGLFNGLFHVTLISQLMDCFIFLIGSLILLAWPLITNKKYNLLNNIQNKFYKISKYAIEYSLLILFSTLGASLLISSADIVSMYLSLELQSFGIYILTTIFRDSDNATSAGLKYFLLGGLSSCLILFGGGLIYSFTGLTNFESIYSLISILETNNIIQGINLGFIFIFLGLLIKIAAAPLYNWAPDVYDDSPTIITIWLTIMPKISILILLLELYIQTFGFDFGLFIGDNYNFTKIKNLLLICSLLSLSIGTIVGLAQTKIKRLLAYSTISHIGFILLALAISNEQSIESFIFYLIQYSITNLNVFLILIALSYLIYNSNIKKNFSILIKSNNYFSILFASLKTIIINKSNTDIYKIKVDILKFENLINLIPEFILKTNNSLIVNLLKGFKKELIDIDIKFISELKGQFFSNPLISLGLSVCLFSMAGIPPLIGFFAKQFVLYSAIQDGYFFISFVAIFVSVISAYYYLKIIRVLHDLNIKTKNNFWEKEIIKLYVSKNKNYSIINLKKSLLIYYANLNNKNNNSQNLFYAKYFKEIQLIFILIFIFKFDSIYNFILNNNNTNDISFNKLFFKNYINKEFWQLNNLSFQFLPKVYLIKTNKELENEIITKYKNLNLISKFKSDFLFRLTSLHSFLISNLTLIILLFVLKPSILLSSTRLLSLSLFTY